ncbi:MAG TPA: DUF2079 domain-containing protein [Polyangiaceae bacterium]|nr:DUF2079 domain-containing protein [Polyangiaceae bacterium]
MVASQAQGSLAREVSREGTAPRVLASLFGLTLVGQSLTQFFAYAAVPAAQRLAYFTQNTLPAVPPALALPTITGFLPLLIALLLLVVERERAPRIVESFTRIVAPAGLAFALPALFTWQLGQHRSIGFLILLGLFGLALERLLRISVAESLRLAGAKDLADARAFWTRLAGRVTRIAAPLVVLLAGVGYAAYTGFFTIRHHHQILTSAFDLGIFDNLMYNTIKGRFFESPVMFGPGHHNSLSTHAEYLMVLFAPLYAIAPRAETLLLIQAVFLGGAVVPLYLFARTLLTAWPSVVLVLAYVLFAPLHGAQFYDFHWLPLGVFFYFWLFYAIAARKDWLVVLMALLLFALREDIAVGLAFLGTFLFITGLRVRMGITLAATAAVWFVINKFVIMPWAGPWWFDSMYNELFADGKSGYGNVVKTLISNPFYAFSTFVRGPKLAYALHMLAPLVFLPVRRLAFWLLLVPGSVFTLMTTGYWPTLAISFQYTTHWVPFLFACAAMSLFAIREGKDGQVRMIAALGALSVVLLSHSYNFGAILQRESFVGGFGRVSFEMSDATRERYLDMRSVADKIPREASVVSTETLNPHISARKDAYVFRYDSGPVDFIFLSENELGGDLKNTLREKFRKSPYGLFAKGKREFYLFKRGYESPATAEALRHLGI